MKFLSVDIKEDAEDERRLAVAGRPRETPCIWMEPGSSPWKNVSLDLTGSTKFGDVHVENNSSWRPGEWMVMPLQGGMSDKDVKTATTSSGSPRRAGRHTTAHRPKVAAASVRK